METRNRGRGSDGQSTPATSPSTPQRKSSTIDVRNNWAGNAFTWREPSTRSAFVQLTAFLFLAGVLSTVVVVNLWANGKVEGLESGVNRTAVVREVRGNCVEREDLIDYAAASNGGSVISAFSSPSYHGSLLEGLVGFNRLDYLISSDNSKAHCWAFEGASGYATIHLARPVFPSQFSLVHINSLQALNAPKDFSLYSTGPTACWLLGSYQFRFSEELERRETVQLFPCRYNCMEAASEVRLEVESNQGDNEVTCIYQLRVHGLPAD